MKKTFHTHSSRWLLMFLLAVDVTPAIADTGDGPADSSLKEAAEAAPAPAGLWDRANLLGDMGGLRPVLVTYGVTLTLH